MTIGERIKSLRTKKGYSQTELADMVGVKQTFISAIEKGVKKPSLELAPKLADILGVSVDELMNKDEKESKRDSFTIMLLERLINEGLIKDPNDISQDELNMILDAIKVDIKRIQKEKGSN